MKLRSFFYGMLAMVTAAGCQEAAPEAAEFSVMSFNIKVDATDNITHQD